VIWFNSLFKLAYVGEVAQNYVHSAFEYLQRWKVYNLSGQPVPVLGHPHSKEVFPYSQTEPPVNRKLMK